MSEATQADWVNDAVARFEAPLLRFTARLLRDPDAARDVVQDASCARSQPRARDGHLAEALHRLPQPRAGRAAQESRMSDQPFDRAPPDGALSSPSPPPPSSARGRGSVRRHGDAAPAHAGGLRLRFQEGLPQGDRGVGSHGQPRGRAHPQRAEVSVRVSTRAWPEGGPHTRNTRDELQPDGTRASPPTRRRARPAERRGRGPAGPRPAARAEVEAIAPRPAAGRRLGAEGARRPRHCPRSARSSR
jgi:hypothetical protein